jgi:AcrR family transcriptional regulator
MTSSVREQQIRDTRARIAEAALALFVSQGYAKTTIDQIAESAGVGRRTVFRHFATKEAILFDQLAVRREVALQRLRGRPRSESPLASLHAVLRELCIEGYDRGLLDQIRTVLATEPQLAGEQVNGGIHSFERYVLATLLDRRGDDASRTEIFAITKMACGWFVTAAHLYLVENRPSLIDCFDEIVAVCVRSGVRDLA